MAQIGGFVPAAQGGQKAAAIPKKSKNPTGGAWRRKLRAEGAEKTDFAAIAFGAPIHDIQRLNNP
jgi:hypothetical protein